eukprot:m.257754 g.257754  ORF g.257754 m.257754 type:complete len:994 (+) comp19184_c4_seq1:117-3098(+)
MSLEFGRGMARARSSSPGVTHTASPLGREVSGGSCPTSPHNEPTGSLSPVSARRVHSIPSSGAQASGDPAIGHGGSLRGSQGRQRKRVCLYSQYVQADQVLILTVREARNLTGSAALDSQPRLRPLYPYLNVFLDPDPTSACRFQSQVQAKTDNPVFQEHFNIPLGSTGQGTRLHVALWDWQGGDRPDVFIGSLSFAIEELLPPAPRVDGWFYLLPQQEGVLGHVFAGPRGAVDHEGRLRRDSVTSRLALPNDLARDRLGSVASLASINPDAVFRDRLRSITPSSDGSSVPISPFSDDVFAFGETDTEDLDMTPEEQQRQESISEFISHVSSYHKDLEAMNQIFVEPLLTDLTSTQHENVFANIDKIFGVTTDFAQRLATRQAVSERRVHLIGDILKKEAEIMRGPYTIYSANKQNARIELKSLLEGDTDFNECLRQTAEDYPGADLNKSLSLPIRFLTSVADHVSVILQHTPPSHDDFVNLQEANQRFSKLVDGISMEVAKLESLVTIHHYGEHLVYPEGLSEFKLLQPGRQFVKEVTATWIPGKSKHYFGSNKAKAKPVTLILFTDVLLIAEQVQTDKHTNHFVVAKPLMLDDYKVLPDKSQACGCLLACKKDTQQFSFASVSEMKSWAGAVAQRRQVGSGTLLESREQRSLKEGASATGGRLAVAKQRAVDIDVATGNGSIGFTLREFHPGFVETVESGGPAEAAGLTPLDRLVSVNGTAVSSLTKHGVEELLASSEDGFVRLIVKQELSQATVMRGSDGELGFALRGTMPVYVRSIRPRGPADKAGLRLGDQLWAINGRPCDRVQHKQAVAMIEQAGKTLQILVRPSLRQVHIKRAPDGYGFTVSQQSREKPIFVRSIAPNSPASAAGLQLGDQLWEVNGVKVRGERASKVEKIFAGTRGALTLVVIASLRDVEIVSAPKQPFGFTLSGDAPVRVGAIDAGSPAQLAGIRPGDAIWQVNGVTVTHASHSEVVQLVRKYPHRTRLKVALN